MVPSVPKTQGPNHVFVQKTTRIYLQSQFVRSPQNLLHFRRHLPRAHCTWQFNQRWWVDTIICGDIPSASTKPASPRYDGNLQYFATNMPSSLRFYESFHHWYTPICQLVCDDVSLNEFIPKKAHIHSLPNGYAGVGLELRRRINC